MKKLSFKQKLGLIVFGVFLCAVLLEVGLRTAGFILLQLRQQQKKISLSEKGEFSILCLGESTTDGTCCQEQMRHGRGDRLIRQSCKCAPSASCAAGWVFDGYQMTALHGRSAGLSDPGRGRPAWRRYFCSWRVQMSIIARSFSGCCAARLTCSHRSVLRS